MTEVDHTSVSIRFCRVDLDPQIISGQLGFIESNCLESTIKSLKDGRSAWSIRLKIDEVISLEKKLELILTQFSSETNLWRTVTATVKSDIFCGLFLDEWNQGFDLSPKIMKDLSDRNLTIGFDIYAPTDSRDKY